MDDSAYQEILDTFSVPPSIRVALSDPTQTIMPIYAGDVIFIATEIRGYWELVLQNNKEGLYFSREAVPSERISEIVRFLELCLDNVEGAELSTIHASLRLQFKDEIIPIDNSLSHSVDESLDFLGFRPSTTSGTFCLGVHCPYGEYTPAFIQEICVLARKQSITKLAVTPAGTIFIPTVNESETKPWRKLLGRYGVSLVTEGFSPYIRHSSNTMSKRIVQSLDRLTVPVTGLTIAIDRDYRDGEATISISSNNRSNAFVRLMPSRFSLRACDDIEFNPDGPMTTITNLSFKQLSSALIRTIKAYHHDGIVDLPDSESPRIIYEHSNNSYSCLDCYTQYAPEYGDPKAAIKPYTEFDLLPESWRCPVCEGPKVNFIQVNLI